MGQQEVIFELSEFLLVKAVKSFGESLRHTMQRILEEVDASWIDWAKGPGRHLSVALTGGGATLPMVKSLAEGSIEVRGGVVQLQPSLPFPMWLKPDHAELEDDYSRIAVSLGGARRLLIQQGEKATVTAGDVMTTPKLGGYYQKGPNPS